MIDFAVVDRAGFRVFGKPATYQPAAGGDALAVTVIDMTAAEVTGLGIVGLAGEVAGVLLRASEVADPREDDTLVMAHPVTAVLTTYRVVGGRTSDRLSRVWRVPLQLPLPAADDGERLLEDGTPRELEDGTKRKLETGDDGERLLEDGTARELEDGTKRRLEDGVIPDDARLLEDGTPRQLEDGQIRTTE